MQMISVLRMPHGDPAEPGWPALAKPSFFSYLLIGVAIMLALDIITIGWWFGKVGMGKMSVLSQLMTCCCYLLLSTVALAAKPDPWLYLIIMLVLVYFMILASFALIPTVMQLVPPQVRSHQFSLVVYSHTAASSRNLLCVRP